MISPLAVHCASFCLSVISEKNFNRLSPYEIIDFYSDIKSLVEKHLISWGFDTEKEFFFIHDVTAAVISVLHSCRKRVAHRQASWIINQLDMDLKMASQKHK